MILLSLVGAALFLAACDEQQPKSSVYKIGLVTNNPNGMKNLDGFREGMAKYGYVAGENVTYIDQMKPLRGGDLKAALKNLVNKKVDLIFTAGTPTGVAAYHATKGSSVPVVFGVIADPVRAGVMTNLSSPGGNLTGVKLNQNQALRLELFMLIVPHIKKMVILYNPNDSAPSSAVAQIKEIINNANVELLVIECPNNAAVTAALENLDPDTDSIFLVPDSVVNKRIKDIVKLANARKIALSGPSGAQIRQGGLMSFGINHHDVGDQAARIADQILKGGKAGDIPVETAHSFLGLNLKTAKAIGISISDEIVRQAKEVIRSDE